ncbi:hypothetical protein KOW79_010386 [Hemibagrus wyckioides]|uniref:RING-type domain-containing protein n=1 Tax=Hemibagrus wyckioides TaxID=337641 RepID=A0A9D3NTT0_9TELE|nr:hypothetical protein KOW79_010386 [Hemibagrus wyckioides]
MSSLLALKEVATLQHVLDCFQPGLGERQILELLEHPYKMASAPSAPEDDGTVRQKGVSDDDICPICQEELIRKRLPVVYCRFGCGNNVHISCMKVWADHQSRSKKQESSINKCTVCSYYHLCGKCFKRSCHPQHSFAVRRKRNQSWQLMVESKKSLADNQEMCTNTNTGVMSQVVPEHVLKIFPEKHVLPGSRLLEPGMQCRLCFQSFRVGQQVKILPCQHKFHSDCIKMWLKQSICCPVDWHVIYNPLTWRGDDNKPICTSTRTSRAQIILTHQPSIVQRTRALGIDSTQSATPNSRESSSLQRRMEGSWRTQ